MALPPNVRVEDGSPGSEGPAYRSPAGGARTITIRGSIPGRALALLGLFLVGGLSSGAVSIATEHMVPGAVAGWAMCSMAFCSLGAVAAVRRAQWARFELAREHVVVTTGPLGARTRIEAWTARAPIVTARERYWLKPLARLPEWEVLVEGEDGRRTRLATLLDEESTQFLAEALRQWFRDASDTPTRHAFAVRFGALPARISCEGDVDAPGVASWRLEARCPREGLGSAAAMLLLALPLTLLFTGLLVFLVTERDPLAGTCPFLFCVGLTSWSFTLVREVALRLSGRAIFEITPAGLAVRVRPWPWPWGRAGVRHPTVLGVTARRKTRRPEPGVLWPPGPGGQRNLPPSFPIDADDAAYVARVLEAYYRAARSREPG